MKENCYHCGDELPSKNYTDETHFFCCKGCLMIYKLFKENNLSDFYKFEQFAGSKPKNQSSYKFLFLDQEEIRKKYVDYEDDNFAKINLYLPSIHCSSCIYLLENIHKLNPSVLDVKVNFTKKEAVFSFDPGKLKLSELANLLEKIGYEPNFGNRKELNKKINKVFLYKLGVAGFAFGSIMLWSFPEYLGLEKDNPEFRVFTSYLSLGVSIPVLLFSARDYFISAYRALTLKKINLDVPITIGIIALYLQSLWTIVSQQGPGYMDSFSGFIFFLLIGKWFQNKSYQSLSFERDYTSYFPVAITRINQGKEEIVEIEKLEEKDEIIVHNEEILPCDSVLISPEAVFDFSFVTGESELVEKKKGDFIYAGGKLIGQQTQLEVKQKSDRSHLTAMWNDLKNEKRADDFKYYQDRVSVYFLLAVFSISLVSGVYWWFYDPARITQIVVSILIVTCPCALALSSPFTLGNIMRLLGRKGLYLKNTSVIENLNETTDIVFDKTGTLTSTLQKMQLVPQDDNFESHCSAIYAVVNSSLHPISLGIKSYLVENYTLENLPLKSFRELSGLGVEAEVCLQDGSTANVRIGSAKFIGISTNENYEVNAYVSIDDKFVAMVMLTSSFRDGLAKLVKDLGAYRLHVLTGDHQKDKKELESLFPEKSIFLFEQTPFDKLSYIRNLQGQNRKVLMLGDGLNDSGALKIADVGIAVSENSFHFTPSSDAIIASESIVLLADLLKISSRSKLVLSICLIFSVLYNILGLSFAISGNLSPLIAAILMPISSITVVFISTILVLILAKK